MNFGGYVGGKWLKECKETRLSSFSSGNLTGEYLKTIIVKFSCFAQSTVFALVGRNVDLAGRTGKLAFEMERMQKEKVVW